MDHRGPRELFDLSRVKTYPLARRAGKVEVSDFVDPAALRAAEVRCSSAPWFRDGEVGAGPDQSAGLAELARHIVRCRREDRPVVVITGAHPIKNGLAPIFVDLIERGMISLYSTTVAGVIHSFELALTGASSESVARVLAEGHFGMAFETGAYLNAALTVGVERGLGFGESIGGLLCRAEFRKEVIDRALAGLPDTAEYLRPYEGFPHPDSCVFAAADRKGIPACVHAGIGTDITDQHPSFDGGVKGAASGRDFLIFAEQMCRFTAGGVVLNVGSAVTGPEVLLKVVSMAANTGRAPRGLWTAVFDLRPFGFASSAGDETSPPYYFRDQKSVATRIPAAFGGTGLYFQGMHRETLVPLYQFICRELGVE